MHYNIAIIGAGISGLSAAYYLEKAGFKNISIFEKSDSVGGVLKTDLINGCLIEQAAESVAKFPQTIFKLIDEIGMSNEIIEPLTSKFQLYVSGKSIAPPAGLRYMIPTNKAAFKESNFFSEEGKQHILKEVEIAPIEKNEGLTLKDFVVHRFGEEMYQRYAAPVYGGIFGYDADKLSLQTIMPQLLKWEMQYGSITKAVENLPTKSSSGAVYFSFKNGIQSFADSIAKHLIKSKLNLNHPVKRIFKKNEKWLVNGTPFDKVIVSTNANLTAAFLTKKQSQLKHLLKKIKFKTAGILTFLYDELLEKVDLETSGILLPVQEFTTFSAITFSSNKWNNRANKSQQLLRLYVRDEGLLNQPKEILTQKGTALLEHLLKIEKQPNSTYLNWWPNSRPLYTIEHHNIVNDIKKELRNTANLHLCGCSYNGSGIASLVHQSKLLVDELTGQYHQPGIFF